MNNNPISTNSFYQSNKIPLTQGKLKIDFEEKIQALNLALEEGINSGIYPNFDPELHLQQLKNRVSKNH